MNKKIIGTLAIVAFLGYSCSTTSDKSANTNTSNAEMEASPQKTTLDNDFIMQSALEGKLETVKDALGKGFDVNTADSNKRTALMMAAYNGHTPIVELLIANGANVNLTDTIQRTALMYASTGPFVPTVNALLQSGADPNMVDGQEKWTAVMMAAAEGQLDVLKVLVSNGADLKMVDIDGESSLDFAKSKGHSAVVDYIASQTK